LTLAADRRLDAAECIAKFPTAAFVDLARSLQLAEGARKIDQPNKWAIALVQQQSHQPPPSRQLISPSYQTYGDEGGLAGISRLYNHRRDHLMPMFTFRD